MTICSSSSNRDSRVPAGNGSLRMKPISASPASRALACEADGISRMVSCTFGYASRKQRKVVSSDS
ncbi:hypothetical protein D3C71_2101890 [compost metagenome]